MYLTPRAHWEILNWWNQSLCNQLSIRGRGLPPQQLRLHSGKLGLKRPATINQSLNPEISQLTSQLAKSDQSEETVQRVACQISSPAFKHTQRVEFTGAAEGDDQQEAADQTADDGCCNDSGGNDDGATFLIAAVTTVVLRVANPRLKHTAVVLQR